MMQTASRPLPLHLAAWIVELSASAEQSESILGDLAEEFSDVASKSGVVSARRWYWRQSVKTIFHLAGAALRSAPWPLTGIVLMGFLLKWFIARLPEQVIVALLRTQHPYSNLHYVLYVWLVTWGIPILRVVQMTLIGCIVAAVANGKEIVATVVLIVISSVIVGSNFCLHVLDLPLQINIPWTFLVPNFANWMGILTGGILVRQIRSASPHQDATP
jgi:hypothetical protein